MKLQEFRLVDLVVKNGENIVFEGKSEEMPEELKLQDSKSIILDNGKAIVQI